MANREEIIKAILAIAGNPASGVIADLAPAFADAIVALDNPVEKRVIEAPEKR